MNWLEGYARTHGLRYEPQADERWLRAWEPYATLKTPHRYEHALHATGAGGSISIARAVVEVERAGAAPYVASTWVAIVQDERLQASSAVTNDFGSAFAEPFELVTSRRFPTGDPAFDHGFASFAAAPEDLERAITPSVRRLLLTWRTPIHAETRPGGFVLAPVSLADTGIRWLFEATRLFGEKASRRPNEPSRT